MEYVIFSIDQQECPEVVNNFLMEFASAGLERNCIRLNGCWNGVKETSFICRADDFKWVKNAGYVKNQECVLKLVLSYYHKFYAVIEDMETGGNEMLGEFVQVSKDEAMKHDCWTQSTDNDTYFIIRGLK